MCVDDECCELSTCSAVRTVWLRPRESHLSAIGANSNETFLEADSHADTTCLGGGALKILDFNTPVNVHGYDASLGSKKYRVISGGVAYVHPFSGLRYHLIFHQAIHMPDLDHHLMCPMQLRANGVKVNDCPRMYCDNPDDKSHAIVATDEYGEDLILPFFLKGVTSYLSVEPLPLEEFEAHESPRVELTSQHLTWAPNSKVFEDQENAMVDHQGNVLQPRSKQRRPLMVVNSVTTSTCADAADLMESNNFAAQLERNVNISHVCTERVINSHSVSELVANEFPLKQGDISSRRKKQVDGATLAKRWNIDPRKAANTIKVTTQRGVRTCTRPSMSRRYPTNDRMLRYNRLPFPIFSDTMESGVISKKGNRYAQAFCTQFGWSRMHPMKRKGDAHEALSLLFHRDGVLPRMVVDNSKEQTLGQFAKKCREADCHLTTTLPYSP